MNYSTNSLCKVNNKSGFSLVEMLVYMGLLLVVSVAAVSLLLNLGQTIQAYQLEQSLLRNSSNVLEQLLVDIRATEVVDMSASVFADNNGSLVLDTNEETVIYELQAGRVLRTVAGSSTVLHNDKVTTTELEFNHIDTGRSVYIQIDMTMQATSAVATSSRQYTAGAVTRAMYE